MSTQIIKTGGRVGIGTNPWISKLSRFHDYNWDFSTEIECPSAGPARKVLHWDFTLPNGDSFTNPKYRTLSVSTKQFLRAKYLPPSGLMPIATMGMYSYFLLIKRFILYLVNRRYPILRFCDVLPHHCQDYISSLVSKKLSASRKRQYVNALSALFELRNAMTDGLTIDPLSGGSIRSILGRRWPGDVKQTEIIRDHILFPLVRASIEYVEHLAPYLLAANDEAARLRSRGTYRRFSTAWLSQDLSPYRETKLKNGVRSFAVLNKELLFLQVACFVLIAFLTGMRVSELLAMREGCCRADVGDSADPLIWIHSRIYKMQGVPAGRKTKWLGGPLCAKAVDVLERLGRHLQPRPNCPHLFRWTSKRMTTVPEVLKSMGARLNDFASMLGLEHIHPHMFRRTFAWHVARYDSTNLLALKEHLKHASILETEYYAQNDPELWVLMMEEAEQLSIESFDKILRADQLAGPGGRRVKSQIDRAIADRRLPKRFRGEAGNHLRKKLIKALVESGDRIYPCANSNYCWFRKESALCTEQDKPILKHCNPGGCANSVVTIEHKPYWQKTVRDCDKLIEMKPEAGPLCKSLEDIRAVGKSILRILQ